MYLCNIFSNYFNPDSITKYSIRMNERLSQDTRDKINANLLIEQLTVSIVIEGRNFSLKITYPPRPAILKQTR